MRTPATIQVLNVTTGASAGSSVLTGDVGDASVATGLSTWIFSGSTAILKTWLIILTLNRSVEGGQIETCN